MISLATLRPFFIAGMAVLFIGRFVSSHPEIKNYVTSHIDSLTGSDISSAPVVPIEKYHSCSSKELLNDIKELIESGETNYKVFDIYDNRINPNESATPDNQCVAYAVTSKGNKTYIYGWDTTNGHNYIFAHLQ